jgi:hypothetical protein
MRKNNTELQHILDESMPPEPDRRKPKYRKIVVTEDPHSWLELQGPSEQQIQAQQNFLTAYVTT